MKKKIVSALKKEGYEWKFANVGGVTRVDIKTGEDIAHLGELDQKMWTVLSCPVKGLEFDEKTLTLMDSDKDGKIRVNELVDAATWTTSVLKDADLLLKGEDSLELSAIDEGVEEGAKLLKSAKQILTNLGLKKNSISIADTADSIAIFAKTKFNGDGVITSNSTDDEELKGVIADCVTAMGSTVDRSGDAGVNGEQIEAFYTACADYKTWLDAAEADKKNVFPYGDNTEAALVAYNTIKDKVADFFMRCKLIAFNADSSSTLDVSVARMEAISDKNLSECTEEIASYPLARVNEKGLLPLKNGINPAWQGVFETLKTLVFDKDFAKKSEINEAEWNSVAAKFAPYEAWKAAKKGEQVEVLGAERVKAIVSGDKKDDLLKLVEKDLALAEEANSIESVDKLLHYYRDLYKLIRNFVTFNDFYTKNQDTKAIFQAGTLFIDQRSCDLCVKVSDMGKHNTQASFSGMYLVYCDCESKVKGEKMTIVAAITQGDISNLAVGKNAIFYDRNGLDWDATVVKIIDNPISIRQAFWSPYRKCAKFIEDQVNKFAAEKDSKMTADMNGKIAAGATNATTATPETIKDNKAQAFDIAKFCGIFAAIGMALGAIGSALAACVSGFLGLYWWQMPLAILAVMLIISGPAMIMAWLKLRKRNLSPLLNANGWAVNSSVLVNILFGTTLTKQASFPTLKLQDPLAKKKGKKTCWIVTLVVVVLLLAAGAALYFTNTLRCVGLPYKEEVVIEEVVTDTIVVPAEAVEAADIPTAE